MDVELVLDEVVCIAELVEEVCYGGVGEKLLGVIVRFFVVFSLIFSEAEFKRESLRSISRSYGLSLQELVWCTHGCKSC